MLASPPLASSQDYPLAWHIPNPLVSGYPPGYATVWMLPKIESAPRPAYMYSNVARISKYLFQARMRCGNAITLPPAFADVLINAGISLASVLWALNECGASILITVRLRP